MKTIAVKSPDKRRFISKLPLLLTVSRLFISPLFLFIYLKFEWLGISFQVLPFILIGLAILSEASDILDGLVARRYRVVTDLGKILDPMSDSITRITMLLAFTQGVVKLPLFLIILFIFRDGLINCLRTLCALKGFALAARTSGKFKAIFQGISIFSILFLMIGYSFSWISLSLLRGISFNLVLATAVYAIISGVEYIWVNRAFLKHSI